MEDKPKVLHRGTCRTKTVDGECAKTEMSVWSNGVISLRRFTLSKYEMEGETKICTKFGKTLYVSTMSFKLSTYFAIGKKAIEILEEHKIQQENIL